MVFECTGDALYAAATMGRVLDAGRPVVTLNAEFHVTVGSHFVERGLLSEAEGDQPGCLAALPRTRSRWASRLSVYGNMKAFLNRDPSPEDMRYWAERQGYSPRDGDLVHRRHQGADRAVPGGQRARRRHRPGGTDRAGDRRSQGAAAELGAAADRLGHPISEYVLDRGLQHGVFIVARHDERAGAALRNLKLGEGPYYVLIKDYCLVHLEVFKTIERLVAGPAAAAQQQRAATGQRRQHRQARA